MGTCIMVVLLCVMCAVDACYLAITNERLQPCQVSQWIAWNCTCCGLNALNLHFATRARGLCCPVDKSHDYGACKRYCNISESMIFEYGSCGFNCRQTLRPSPCLHTTRGSTRAVSFTPLPASSTYHTSPASSVAANATWTRHKHRLPEKTAADHCYIGSLKYIVDENFVSPCTLFISATCLLGLSLLVGSVLLVMCTRAITRQKKTRVEPAPPAGNNMAYKTVRRQVRLFR